MAHLIEIDEAGKAMMAYTGATPWHNLGTRVDDSLTPREMQVAAGLDWTVEKVPQFVQWNGGFVKVPDTYGLQRSTDGRILTTVGSMYKPVQPSEAMEFFSEFVHSGDMKMNTAGGLDRGRIIWALAEIQDGFELAGGDRVDGYLLLSCPYRIGESFTVKFTKVRVVCNNTRVAALSDQSYAGCFRMGHMKEFDAKMREAAKVQLGLAREAMREEHQKSEVLASSHIKSEQVLIEYVAALSGSKVLDAILDSDEADSAAENGSVLDAMIQAEAADKQVRAVRESDLNRVGKSILENILSSPGSDLPSARGTWWGAVNGVTYAVDHQMGRTEDSRLTSAWFGPRAGLKNKAFDLALQYAQGQVAAA